MVLPTRSVLQIHLHPHLFTNFGQMNQFTIYDNLTCTYQWTRIPEYVLKLIMNWAAFFFPTQISERVYILLMDLDEPEADLAKANIFSKIFPDNLAKVLQLSADSFCIPINCMINAILGLISVFSFTSYISRPQNNQVEPLMELFINNGESGINKTSTTFFFKHVFEQLTAVMKNIAGDCNGMFLQNYYLSANEIPVMDNTATQAASIQKI